MVTFYKTWLKQHLKTPTHQKYVKSTDQTALQEAINALGRTSTTENTTVGHQTNEVQKQESIENLEEEKIEKLPLSRENEGKLYLTLAQFMINLHLPFCSAGEILGLVQTMVERFDSDLILNAHISAPTATIIIKNCIGSVLKEKLLEKMADSPYSILIDEASDVFRGKYVSVLIRHLDYEKESVVNTLVAILQEDTSYSGESLYNLVKNEIFDFKPELRQNLIAIATDNAPNMVSSQGAGFTNRVIAEIPNVIHIRDFCHCYNLVCEKALTKFPYYIIQFVKNICIWFNHTQRTARLRAIQEQQNEHPVLDIIQFCDTRWLNLEECTGRILKLWTHLEKYFEETDSNLKVQVKDIEFKLFTQLLYILLHKLNSYNVELQAADLLYDEALNKIRKTYTLFAKMISKPYFQDAEFDYLFEIPFEKSGDPKYIETVASNEEFRDYFLENYKICVDLLEKAKLKRTGIEKEFLLTAKSFIIETLVSLKERLPYNNKLINNSEFIYLKKGFQVRIWEELADAFPKIIPATSRVDFHEELQKFALDYKKNSKEHIKSENSILKTWNKLSKEYKNMARLAKALLVLPFSTALVESSFSEFKVYKTPYRNRISPENLEASLIAEQYFRKIDPCILPEMVTKYFSLWEPETSNSKTTVQSNSNSNTQEVIASIGSQIKEKNCIPSNPYPEFILVTPAMLNELLNQRCQIAQPFYPNTLSHSQISRPIETPSFSYTPAPWERLFPTSSSQQGPLNNSSLFSGLYRPQDTPFNQNGKLFSDKLSLIL